MECSHDLNLDYNLCHFYWKQRSGTMRKSASWFQNSQTPATRKLGNAFTLMLKEVRESLQPVLGLPKLVQEYAENATNLFMIFGLEE